MNSLMLHLVTSYLADDVNRAVTFPGGYVPTARVLIQRERSALRSRALEVAKTAVLDVYEEPSGESGFVIGVRDNRDALRHAEELGRVRDALRDAGMKTRIHNASFVVVYYDRAREDSIEGIADDYADDVRLEAIEKRDVLLALDD